jgi:hypothetical protein
MIKANRFAKGSGVYVCGCCGARTRDTGMGGAFAGMCDPCYNLSGFYNMIQDGQASDLTKNEIERIIQLVGKVYSKTEDREWDELLEAVIEECAKRKGVE